MQSVPGSTLPLRYRSSFVAARAALAYDDVAAAQPVLEAIAAALPDNLEVALHAAWARARLAHAQTDGERDMLEALARRGLKQTSTFAVALCILGHGAIRRGQLMTARRLFRRAADADPTILDARRGVRMVETRLARGLRRSGTKEPRGWTWDGGPPSSTRARRPA